MEVFAGDDSLDYYSTLEVSPNASTEVIKMAYWALVKKYHPDIYQGDKSYAEEMMKNINKAYRVLSNSELRSRYDSTRTPAPSKQAAPPAEQHVTPNASPPVRQSNPVPPASDNGRNPPLHLFRSLAGFIMSGIWKLAKIALAAFVIYGLFTESLLSNAESIWNTVKWQGEETVKTIVQKETPDQTAARNIIGLYLTRLKNADQSADSCLHNDKLKQTTDAAIQIYLGVSSPNEFGHEMISEVRKFNYKIDSPTLISNAKTMTADVDISVVNLYAVSLSALQDYNDKTRDENWVSQYVLQKAAVGESDLTDAKIFEEFINLRLQSNAPKMNTKVQFKVEQVNGTWLITDITELESFKNAITGNFAEVAEEIQETVGS